MYNVDISLVINAIKESEVDVLSGTVILTMYMESRKDV